LRTAAACAKSSAVAECRLSHAASLCRYSK
jgi:hypothetical protein